MSDSQPTFDPQKLTAARREKGLSQRALAAVAGVSQAAIAEFEGGKRPPKPAFVEKVAKALGVGVERFAT